MDKKSAMMKPEKKGARPKQKMKEQKIEDVLASEEGQEGKEEDETEAMTKGLLGKETEGRMEAKNGNLFH